jgi:hypothetical protein
MSTPKKSCNAPVCLLAESICGYSLHGCAKCVFSSVAINHPTVSVAHALCCHSR